MATTISHDFLELRRHIAELEPEAIPDELDQLVTRQDGEPSPLTAMVGAHEIAYDFNGQDDVIELLEEIEGAVFKVPDAETRAYLSRHAIGSILEAFDQVDSHVQATRDVEHLAREAAQLTEYIADPRQEAFALFAISKAVADSKAAHVHGDHESPLFWDTTMYLEDAGKAIQREEDPEVRSRILGLLARSAAQNISIAEVSGVIESGAMGDHFTERMRSLSERLFGEAMVIADASFFTDESAALPDGIEDPLGLADERSAGRTALLTATGRMAQHLVQRLTGAAS